MRVRVRDYRWAKSLPFTEIHASELNKLVSFIEESSGFYHDGEYLPFHSYQLVLDNDACYCEILVGKEPLDENENLC